MKKILILLTTTLAIAITGSSCSDVLDLDPSDRFSPATIWNSPATADSYALGFYSIFRERAELEGIGESEFKSPAMSDAYSDILKSCSWTQYNHNYNRVLFESTSFNGDSAGAFECWKNHYDKIRRQNEFLRDAPTFGGHLGKEWLDIRIAEVRFARAYTYFRLTRVYGGVILRTEVDGPVENNKARSTERECWDYIIAELKAAALDLPESWDSSETGRATKKAAYGLLSRIALYSEDWTVAAQAASDAETFGGKLLSNYADVFTAGIGNAEILFAIDFKQGVLTHSADVYLRPSGDTREGRQVYSGFAPTSELVDSYEMADGSVFAWPNSDPYAGREPRFYATILYNGADWMGRKIESFVGGADGFKAYEESGAAGTTVTGYYLRKYLVNDDKSWVGAMSGQYNVTLRFAEVLLNKAEALAEANWGANGAEALIALNRVRSRVDLPARVTSNKDTFMEYLRHERIVELAGEGFRYYDLRRWKLAEEVINGQNAHGVKIIKAGDGSFSYEQVDVDAGKKRIFYDRYYRFAIPLLERSNNSLCDNNIGWI